MTPEHEQGTSARSAVVLLLALSTWACGDGQAVDGVLHLDPRLEDGGSSLEALAGDGRLLRRWAPRDPQTAADSLAPWSLRNAVLGAATRAQAGVLVRAADYDPSRGIDHALLVHNEALAASDVDTLEVDLFALGAVGAALTWSQAESGERGHLEVTTSAGLQTLRFPLAGRSAWRGTVRDLTLHGVLSGPQTYELVGIRFLKGGFEPGPQPGARHGEDSGDSGLLGFAGDLRRTWVSDFGVPLMDEVRVPASGRLIVDVGSPDGGALTFEVAVETHAEPWVTVATAVLVPDTRHWTTLTADLSNYAGKDVRLRFLAHDGAREDRPSERPSLERARVWWGAPQVASSPPSQPRPSILFVTLDTLRADHVGCLGGPPLTPVLDALAGSGLTFTSAWSGCNSTLPSHVSLLTGLDVPAHGTTDNRSTLADSVRTLPQALREAGYHTAAAVSVPHLQAGFSGLGRGFDRFLEVQPGATVDGAATLGPVEDWLRAMEDEEGDATDRPLFLWVHLFDPHTPYGPPQEFMADFVRTRAGAVPAREADPPSLGPTRYADAGGFLNGVTNEAYARFLYGASVAYADHLLGRLLDAADSAGWLDGAIVVVVADHGESLGEHDIHYGHQMLHPEVLHVPLVLRLPGGPRGRVDARVSTVDLACTLGRYLDLDGPWSDGSDLLAAAAGETPPERRVYFVHSDLAQVGCRDEAAHYFHNLGEYRQFAPRWTSPAEKAFLYLQPGDPGCSEDRSEGDRALVGRYRALTDAWLAAASTGERVRAVVSDEQDERLRALGYGGDGEDGDGEDGE